METAAAIFDDPRFERSVERIVRRLTTVDSWMAPKEIASAAVGRQERFHFRPNRQRQPEQIVRPLSLGHVQGSR